jgi:hypothetical protein
MLRDYPRIVSSRLMPPGALNILGMRLGIADYPQCPRKEEEDLMAQFCTKCGSPLAEGTVFCTSCGATAGAPAAPSAQAPPPQPAMGRVAPAPAVGAPAKSSGSPVVKIILIVLAIVILLGLLSAASCVYFVYRTKQRVKEFQKQTGMTFPMPTGIPQGITPGGQAPAAPAGAVVDTGIPVYPGATPWGGGSQFSGPTASMKAQAYTTGDSVDQVAAFYKDKMGSKAMVSQAEGKVVVQTFGENGEVSVVITSDARLGKTKIEISTVGK